MNLSPMMYRLNHAQGQKLPLAAEQQQQPQQQPQTTQTPIQTQSQQQQIIPSHILLQQQLDAASANASNNASSSSSSNPSTSTLHHTHEPVFLNNFNDNEANTPHQSLRQATTSSLLHSIQHHQPQQHTSPPPPPPNHSRHLNNAPANNLVITNAAAAAAALVAASAVAAGQMDALTTTSSVEENLKLLKTAIKSEPLQHDTSPHPHNNTHTLSGCHSGHSNLSNVLSATNNKDDIITLAACSALANVIPASNAAAVAATPSSMSSAGVKANVLKNSSALSNAITQVALTGSTGGGGSVVSVAGSGVNVSTAGSVSGEALTTSNGSLVFVPSKRARMEL